MRCHPCSHGATETDFPSYSHAGLAGLLACRAALGAISVAAFSSFRRGAERRLGSGAAAALVPLVALQFHLPFYMSRLLPNTLALGAAHVAMGAALCGQGHAALFTLGAAAATLRCDLLLLIAPLGLWMMRERRVGLLGGAAATLLGAALAAGLSVLVDSHLWGRPLWPELEVLLFNTVANRSSEWGVSPPLWYLYSALPRALLGALPLAVAGALAEPRVRAPLACGVAFVALYSLLPHKETRFLYPALPAFNLAAAVALARATRPPRVDKGKHWTAARAFALLAAVGCLAASALGAFLLSAAAYENYPGGMAMAALHAAEQETAGLSVHIENAAAMTGVSRFLEEGRERGWAYSKEEGLPLEAYHAKGFDRLVTGHTEVPGFACTHSVLSFDGYELVSKQELLEGDWWPPIDLRVVPTVYLHQRLENATQSRGC